LGRQRHQRRHRQRRRGGGQNYSVNADNFANSGTINVAAGAIFYRGAGFTNTGTLSGSGMIVVGTGTAGIVNQGAIIPGGTGATGTLTIAGDLQLLTGSNLLMELGGVNAGQFDRVLVTGAVSGNAGSFGDMAVSKINGYTYANASGDAFALLSAASGADSATFGAVTLARSNLTRDYSAANFTLNMAPMVLTVSANAAGKSYGGIDPGLSYSGVTGFDTNTLDTAATALSGTLGRAAGENAGAYAINLGSLVSQLGYAIDIAPAANFTITPAAITVTSANVSKVYDGGLTALGTAMVGGGTLYFGDTLSGGAFAFTDKNAGAGNKTVSVGGVTVNDGNGGGNYVVSYADNSGSSITRAALTLGGARAYDGGGALGGGVLTATRVGGETFAITGAGGAGNLASKNVQTGATLANLAGLALGASANGGLSGNYDALSTVGSSVDITRAALTVTAGAAGKTYDGTLVASGAGTVGVLAGALAGDSVSASGGQAYLDKNAGTGKTVRASGVTIKDAGNFDVSANYNISYTDNLNGSIAKAALNVAAGAAGMTYDGTLVASGAGTVGVLAGALAGDSVSGTGGQAYLDKNAGMGKTVRASGVTIKDAGNFDVSGNYDISYTDNLNGSIAKAALVVTTNSVSKAFDGLAYSGGNGAVIFGGSSQSAIKTGSYALTSAGLTSNNYALNFVDGQLTIGAEPPAPPVPPVVVPPSLPTPATNPPSLGFASAPKAEQGLTSTPPPSQQPGRTGGASAAPSGDIGGVKVSVLPAAAGQSTPIIAISVSQNMGVTGGSFSVALPVQIADSSSANGAAITVTTEGGGKLPSWLTYKSNSKSIVVSDVPEGGLPIRLQVMIDGKQTTVVISARTTN